MLLAADVFVALGPGVLVAVGGLGVLVLVGVVGGPGVLVAVGGRGVFVGSGAWLTKPETGQVSPIPSNPKIRSTE